MTNEKLLNDITSVIWILQGKYRVSEEKATEAAYRAFANIWDKDYEEQAFFEYFRVAAKNELIHMFHYEKKYPMDRNIDLSKSLVHDPKHTGFDLTKLDQIADKLPKVYKELFELLRQGIDHREIARRLNKSHGAVRVMKTRMIQYCQAVILSILLLVPMLASAQVVTEVNIVRNGYWQVVSPDTITNHTDAIQATERQLNLLLSGVEASQIVIKPPLYEIRPTYSDLAPGDTVYIEQDPDTVQVEVPGDTVYAYQEKVLYATEIPDTTAMYYDVHESLRNIDWQVVEDSTNADLFRIRIHGTTTADRISFASKCIGHDADMNLITQTESIHLTPDADGKVEGETPDYKCHPQGGNAAMNTWLTARFDNAEDILVIGYIDIAHMRSLQ